MSKTLAIKFKLKWKVALRTLPINYLQNKMKVNANIQKR